MSIVIDAKDRWKIASAVKPPNGDCQNEARVVSLRSPVMGQLLRSLGVDPAQWWVDRGTEMLRQGLRDIEANSSRARAREVLLAALEEYRS